jgi:tRNA(Ile)-lysidine synthetase-like protein
MRSLGGDPPRHEVEAILRGEHRTCDGVDVWAIRGGRAFLRAPLVAPAPVTVDGVMSSREWGITVRVEPQARLIVRSRLDGDRVQLPAGTRKVQDVLVDAKVPRPLRPLVPILADERGTVAVGAKRSHATRQSGRVLSVEPYEQTWSREMAWIG